MDSEIQEYEEQLAEVRAALAEGESEELREVERELNSLIAELKKKLPKFSVGTSVILDGRAARVISVSGAHPKYGYSLKFEDASHSNEAGKLYSETALADAAIGNNAINALNVQSQVWDSKEPQPRQSSQESLRSITARRPVDSQYTKEVPPKPAAKADPNRGPVNSRSEEEPANLEFEKNRSRWQSFAQRKVRTKPQGPMAPAGVTKKPAPARRPHFAR